MAVNSNIPALSKIGWNSLAESIRSSTPPGVSNPFDAFAKQNEEMKEAVEAAQKAAEAAKAAKGEREGRRQIWAQT